MMLTSRCITISATNIRMEVKLQATYKEITIESNQNQTE